MAGKNMSTGENLKDRLLTDRRNKVLKLSEAELDAGSEFCEGYKEFLDRSKTEREAVNEAVRIASENGFVRYDPSRPYMQGDRIYTVNRNKSIILCVFGRKKLKDGIRMIASHIDSPRLDLKPCPIYEDSEIGLLKTHYYGGVKKYQWTAIPLSLHGIVIRRDGTSAVIDIGEREGDMRFTVTDLLPHLAAEQMKRTLSEGIKGEELNILAGSLPYSDEKEGDGIKLNIMRILNEMYDITESELFTSELEAVPAFSSCDIGLDRSMVGAYGQDDRACAYTSLMATVHAGVPEETLITVLTDKEEVGSEGNTGLSTEFLRFFIDDIAAMDKVETRKVLAASKCLSADVTPAYDPTFADVFDKNNTPRLNCGVVITKYTGAGGKGGASDASAEYASEIRNMLDDAGITWQTGELGKVDMGGGGTVSKFLARYDMDVIDIGIPVLSIHSPMEVAAKTDIYMLYKAFRSFVNDRKTNRPV